STGVKDSVTAAPAAWPSDCAISGMCWCAPPTLYADTSPITSLPSRCAAALRPAPLVPLDATTTRSDASTRAAASRGASASVTAEACDHLRRRTVRERQEHEVGAAQRGCSVVCAER